MTWNIFDGFYDRPSIKDSPGVYPQNLNTPQLLHPLQTDLNGLRERVDDLSIYLGALCRLKQVRKDHLLFVFHQKRIAKARSCGQPFWIMFLTDRKSTSELQ